MNLSGLEGEVCVLFKNLNSCSIKASFRERQIGRKRKIILFFILFPMQWFEEISPILYLYPQLFVNLIMIIIKFFYKYFLLKYDILIYSF